MDCVSALPLKPSPWLSPVNKALTAIPIKIMRSGSSPDLQDNEYTRKNAKAPPKKAKRGTKKYSVGKNATTSMDINPAPAETPIIPGSANGLRITACNSTPATDKAAPANRAIRIRGSRKSLMIATSSFVPVKSP